nr:carbohydrate ABC transporter permease [uncultured Schaedlerella sp.]
MKRKKKISQGIIHILLILFSIISLFPLYWLITTSLKPSLDVFSVDMLGFFKPSLENYETVLMKDQYPKYLLNSVITSLSTVAITMPIGSMAGYAFARLKMKKKDTWFFMILTTRMAPAVTFAVPIYLMMVGVGMIDHTAGLVIVYVFSNMALCIWLTRSFFEDVPKEIEEAAMVDGVSKFGAFIRFAVPIASGGLVATAILIFIFSWNEFFFASILTQNAAKTFTVHLTSFFGSKRILWGELAAASTLGASVPIVFALIMKQYIIRGLTMGAVKE